MKLDLLLVAVEPATEHSPPYADLKLVLNGQDFQCLELAADTPPTACWTSLCCGSSVYRDVEANFCHRCDDLTTSPATHLVLPEVLSEEFETLLSPGADPLTASLAASTFSEALKGTAKLMRESRFIPPRQTLWPLP